MGRRIFSPRGEAKGRQRAGAIFFPKTGVLYTTCVIVSVGEAIYFLQTQGVASFMRRPTGGPEFFAECKRGDGQEEFTARDHRQAVVPPIKNVS